MFIGLESYYGSSLLCKQPWSGMNRMQVAGTVSFQHCCLVIPDDMDLAITDIIKQCWQT
ncbi:hypothetical protein S83_052080 [Arachis hypogaea]